MMLRQVAFRVRREVTLETVHRVPAGIEDEIAAPAADCVVFAAGTVTGFAIALTGTLRALEMNPRLKTAGRLPFVEPRACPQIRGEPRSIRLSFDADEHVTSRRFTAIRFIRAVGKLVGLHRQGKPVGAGDVGLEFGHHRPGVGPGRAQDQVRANDQAGDPDCWWWRRVNRLNDATETVDRTPIAGVHRGGRIGRHRVSDRTRRGIIAGRRPRAENLEGMNGGSAHRKGISPSPHQGQRGIVHAVDVEGKLTSGSSDRKSGSNQHRQA